MRARAARPRRTGTQLGRAGWGRPATALPGREQTERLRKRTRQLALANALGTRLAGMTEAQAIVDAAVDELHRAFGYYTLR